VVEDHPQLLLRLLQSRVLIAHPSGEQIKADPSQAGKDNALSDLKLMQSLDIRCILEDEQLDYEYKGAAGDRIRDRSQNRKAFPNGESP